MSSATQLELTVAEGLLDALDTPLGIATARRLLKDDAVDADGARALLEAMLEEDAASCPACGRGGFAESCAGCGHLAEADANADYDTNIGEDGNLPPAKKRKKRRRRKPKVEEATVISNTTAGNVVGGTRTAWGGAPYAGAPDSVAGARSSRGRDRDFQPRMSTGTVDAVLTRGDGMTSPPNLREAEGFQACASCVFFHKGCNLYGWDRDGTPAGSDVVHRGQFPVDQDDLCDAWTTLTPNQARLVEALDREDGRLAEAARAENAQMIVRARARVRRGEELLSEAIDAEGLAEAWAPEARAAALLARKRHAGKVLPSGSRHLDKFGSEVLNRDRGESAMHYAMRRLRDKPPSVGASSAGAKALYGKPRRRLSAAVEEAWDGFLEEVKSAAYPGLDRSPKENWVDKAGGLPSYIERIAKHLHYEQGFTVSHAIASAVNTVKRWAAGGGGVKPDTRAKAAKAVAQWEAKKGKAKLSEAAAVPDELLARLEEVASAAYPGLDRSPKENWVDKAGGLPRYIDRIAKHLHYEKGKEIGHAIAIAVNVVKKMCASGDTNFPGKQSVNPKSRAEACAAVAQWEAKKGKAKAKRVAESYVGPPSWDDFDSLVEAWESAYRPVPPSDRYVESLLREVARAEGRGDWMVGLQLLDEAEALLERYEPWLEEGLAVGLEEGAVRLFFRPNKSGYSGTFGHWDPVRHPRAPKGRKGGGEFTRTAGVLAGIQTRARGGVGGRDRQRGYRHPADAPAHERVVAEMFDREAPDKSIFPAERKALGSYLRRRGAADVAKKVEQGSSRMLTGDEQRAIATAVRGDGRGIGAVGHQRRPAAMAQLAGPASTRRLSPSTDKHRSRFEPNAIGYSGTFAHDAAGVEDAFKDHNAAHGRRNEGAGSVDQAIHNVLKSFPGLEDWDVAKKGKDYHLTVKVKGETHVISVTEKGETSYLSGPQKKELGSGVVPAKLGGTDAKGKPSKTTTSHAVAALHMLEPTGENEKPYHMKDGDFFQGNDGVLYQKLESGPHLMKSKKGQPLAAVLIHNHKTGTQKVAPAFALKDYYDVLRPKGHHGGHSSVAAQPAPSHGDIEAQLAKSIGGQKGISKDAGHAAYPVPSGVDVKGKHVVVTGTIPGKTRVEAHAALKAAGAIVHSSVSKQVDYLIHTGKPHKTKMAAAQKHGTHLIHYEDVKALLEGELAEAAAAELGRLAECSLALEEASSTSEVVRLRARRRVLLQGLGIEERDFSSAERDKLAGKGHAMADGSFPIKTEADLRNARRAVGRAHPSKRPAVRAHIRKRAKALGVSLEED